MFENCMGFTFTFFSKTHQGEDTAETVSFCLSVYVLVTYGFSFFQRLYRLYSAQLFSPQMVKFLISSSVINPSGMFLIVI